MIGNSVVVDILAYHRSTADSSDNSSTTTNCHSCLLSVISRVNVRRVAWLLNARRAVLTIATCNVRQLVAIRLAVHGVREALTMRGLVHLRTSTTARDGIQSSDTSDSTDTTLLDATSLTADHSHTSIGDIACKTNTGATGSLIRGRVVDPIDGICRVVTMLHHEG